MVIEDADHASAATDVGVVNITDRRKIRALESQVEDLQAKLAGALERVKPGLTRGTRECYHHGSFEVSEDKLEVNCKECGALMDPYTVLRKIAHREVNFCYTLNALRDEATALAAQVKKAKGTLSRLRASIRKATPDVAVAELGAFMRKVDAKAFVVQAVGGTWSSSFRFDDGFRGTRDVYGKGGGVEVAIRGAMDKADPSRVDGGAGAG